MFFFLFFSSVLYIYSIHDYIIPPNHTEKISTGLSVQPPIGTYGRIASRSSLVIKNVTVEGGVIDADYTGELKICLKNSSMVPFQVKRGDRIAQYICECVRMPEIIEVEENFKSSSQRGNCGFGSTGQR